MNASTDFLPDVSRETRARLEAYAALLKKWSGTINLVSRSTLDDLWERHIADSAQLLRFLPPNAKRWADLGSGAGLPGMVIAILRPDLEVTLVESDRRKAEFLRAAARCVGAQPRILTSRIEETPPLDADVISARALAPLPTLLRFAERHLAPHGVALFPKGARYREELDAALETWSFRCETEPSQTESGAVVLQLSEIARV